MEPESAGQPWLRTYDGHLVGDPNWQSRAGIPEGQECPTCMRRVPRKAKPSSPKTKVVSLRVPIDDADLFDEILEAAAKNAGLYEKGHWKFWTVHRGLVLLLQENGDRLQAALHLLADEAMESGMEIGELIEERRSRLLQEPPTHD